MTTRCHITAFLLALLLTPVLNVSGAEASYEGWTVVEVSVTGLPSGVGKDAARQLGLASPSGFSRTAKVRFREEILQRDLRRLRLLLARAGYPYARIETRFEPRSGPYNVRVVFQVVPGRGVVVGRLDVVGLPPGSARPAAVASEALPVGGRFSDAAVQAAKDEAVLALKQDGYARARAQVAVDRPDSFTADIRIRLEPGARCRFRGARASGVPPDLERLAIRTIGDLAGEWYSPGIPERSNRYLRELQLFRQIRIETADVAEDSLDLLADLKPAAMRTGRVSIGSWSDDPVRLRAQWRHRNYFGGGRGLEFRGSFSPHLQELGAGVWWPALLAPRSRNDLAARFEREAEDAYRVEVLTLETAAVLLPADRTALRLAVGVEHVHVRILSDDPDVYDGESGPQLVLSGRWHRDRADHLLYPTRGDRWTLELVCSPPDFLSHSPFFSSDLEGSVYRPLTGGIVLAARVGGSWAAPLGEATDLQPNRRFFAGGVNTMRGYKRRRLGPFDDDGDPIGGEARLLAGAELRVPVVGFLEAALFLDAGQVWRHRDAVRPGDLETATGLGLIIHTPVGPVRLDAARLNTDPRPGEPRTVIHLAVGHPY